MESRREKNVAPHGDSTPVQVTSVEAAPASREQFCDYLVGAREESGKSLDEIADVTRIPIRSLERLEAGEFEKLPADVFVRGFLRSYARCVGLDIDETVRRYAECGLTPAPVASPMADELLASLETLETSTPSYRTRRLGTQASAEAAPAEGTPAASEAKAEVHSSAAVPAATSSSAEKSAPNTATAAEGTEGTSKAHAAPQGTRTSRSRRRKRRRRKRKRQTSAAPAASMQANPAQAAQAVQAEADQADEDRAESAGGQDPRDDAAVEEPAARDAAAEEPAARDVAEDSQAVPEPAPRKATSRPILVIDDARPEEAERIQEERQSREREDATWRNFLPPALLDSEEGSRRGALTLAVIILVIVATLTMSYLMRRPNDSGDGVTQGIWAPGDTAVSERGSQQAEGRAAV